MTQLLPPAAVKKVFVPLGTVYPATLKMGTLGQEMGTTRAKLRILKQNSKEPGTFWWE